METVSAEVLRTIFANRGAGRMSYADKKHFYAMARSSLFESVALLRILKSQQ